VSVRRRLPTGFQSRDSTAETRDGRHGEGISDDTLKADVGQNFHVRYPSVFEVQREDLVLVKGGEGSRLLTRSHRISAEGVDRTATAESPLPAMQEVVGDFGGRISIQRSPPRWVEKEFVEKAIKFVKGLP